MKYVLTYGIACIEEIDGKLELVTRVPDVTINRAQAECLVDNLNKNHLSPEHLADVVEDILNKI